MALCVPWAMPVTLRTVSEIGRKTAHLCWEGPHRVMKEDAPNKILTSRVQSIGGVRRKVRWWDMSVCYWKLLQ